MILARTRDPEIVNRVVNDPAVRPDMGAPELGPLDLTDSVRSDNDWWLMGEHGGFGLIWCAPGVREVHALVLPEGRGEWAQQGRAELVDYARSHGVRLLWARIRPASPHIRAFALCGGMKDTGETVDVFGEPYRAYSLELN